MECWYRSRTCCESFLLLDQKQRSRPSRLNWRNSLLRDFQVDPLLDSQNQQMHWVLYWPVFPARKNPPLNSDLTVHEWGRFTSIAGHDGHALDWLPLSGPADLPSFVEHFRGCAKCSLRGTVRMETPVLYFHARRAMTLSVKVSFAKGVITEWYPHADRVEPNTALSAVSLQQKNVQDGSIAWDSVTVDPSFKSDYPRESGNSRYYAARDTSATPLRVKGSAGDQKEKLPFLPRCVRLFPAGFGCPYARGGQIAG